MRTLFITLILITLSSNTVSAKRGLFGKTESIEKIQELEVKGPNGEDLYLAYKTTGVFFIAGIYFSDDGYVLGIKGKFGSYYPLDDALIKKLKEANQLPSPLPEYDISWTEYAFGFSGWIIIPLLLLRLFYFFKNPSEDDNEETGESSNENSILYYNLGNKYYSGEDGQVDYAKAYEAFEKAAQLGHLEAIYNTGYMLCYGEGVEKNTEIGYKYLKFAEQKGHEKATKLTRQIEEQNNKN